MNEIINENTNKTTNEIINETTNEISEDENKIEKLVPGTQCYFLIYNELQKGTIIKKDNFIENNFLIDYINQIWSIPLDSIFLKEKDLKKVIYLKG